MAISKPSLSDAEFREDVLQDFVGGDGTAARDGAEVGDDLADFFAQKVGRKAVGETVEGLAECFAGRRKRFVMAAVRDDRITLLNEAPLCDFSSTEVRRALEQGDDASAMLTPEVLAYIREKRLWDPVRYAERLTERIGEEPCNAALLVERGRWYYRRQEWGKALNDFNRALGIDPARDEARQYAEQIEEILAFRYKDIYNP